MQIVCPCCSTAFPLQAGINDVAARNAIVDAFRLTPVGELLLRYVQMFKPAKSSLSMTRMAKLLHELVDMIKAGQITRNGVIYPAPQGYWQQALEEMMHKRESLTLPLKGHGYLMTVIAGYADKTVAQQEQKAEDTKRFGGIAQGQQKHIKTGAPVKLTEHLKNLQSSDSKGGSDAV